MSRHYFLQVYSTLNGHLGLQHYMKGVALRTKCNLCIVLINLCSIMTDNRNSVKHYSQQCISPRGHFPAPKGFTLFGAGKVFVCALSISRCVSGSYATWEQVLNMTLNNFNCLAHSFFLCVSHSIDYTVEGNGWETPVFMRTHPHFAGFAQLRLC